MMTLSLDGVLRHMLPALVAGALIGTERSFHGRAAGFRTHTLVCLSSSVLMLVTVYQAHWFPAMAGDAVRIDPTRMAQGIMTGIGFLGAGVIFREGLTVRGLTTAASIWTTAAVGVLMGVGLYCPAPPRRSSPSGCSPSSARSRCASPPSCTRTTCSGSRGRR